MPDKVSEMEAILDGYVAEAMELDLDHMVADPKARTFGGVWMPGWCDDLY